MNDFNETNIDELLARIYQLEVEYQILSESYVELQQMYDRSRT